MDVSFLIRLIDEFTGPAQKLRSGLKGVAAAGKEMQRELGNSLKQGFLVKNIEQASKNAEAALTRAKGRLMGALALGVALAAPVKSLGDFEDKLTDFGNVASIYENDLKRIGDSLREIAPEVNKSATELLSALEYMVGKGIDPETALKALKAVGMTSTATKSSIEDMAASGFAVIDNLRVPAENLQQAYDAMAASGKKGGFELKGMAQYFPKLTASARALKMEGVPAVAELSAALQIAMKGAGDESTAANNLQNFLSKMSSRETVANFKKFGVNVEAEFALASEKGISVFEHMIGVINKVTDGGDQFKVQRLFGDAQVLDFLKPMLANLEEYKTIRDAALSSDGINLGDFERNTDTLLGKVKALTIEINNLTTAGAPLLEVAKDLTTQLTTLVATMNQLSAANPELTKQLVLATAGLAAFGIVGRFVSFIIASIRGPAIALARTFFMFNEAGKNVAIGWRILSASGRGLGLIIRLLMVGISALGTAAAGITAPIWGLIAAIIAALVALAFAIWKYWDRITSFFTGLTAPIAEALSGMVSAIANAANGVIEQIGRMTGLDPEVIKAAIAKMFDFSPIIDGAKAMLDGFWAWMGSFFSQEKLSDESKAEIEASGRAIGQALVDGVKNAAQAIFDWFAQWPDMIAEAIGTIDLGAMFNWGEPPDWLKWVPGLGNKPQPAMAPLSGDRAPLNQDVKTTIAASVTDNRPPNVQVNAPITINGATDAKSVGKEVKTQLGTSISNARTGALHGGGGF